MDKTSDVKVIVGICDDERIYRDRTKKLCAQFIKKGNIKVEILEFSTGEELLSCKIEIDILFLDIIMDGINGISIKDKFGAMNSNTIIIFQTSFINQMQKAFGTMVLGFLIKPIEENEFYSVMKRALKKIRGRLVVEVEYEYKKYWIKVDNIIYIKSEDKYTSIVTEERNYFIRRKMSEWETIFVGYDFCRVHRCFIINLNRIKRLEGYKIIMDNYDYVNISKNRKEHFMKELYDFSKKNAV